MGFHIDRSRDTGSESSYPFTSPNQGRMRVDVEFGNEDVLDHLFLNSTSLNHRIMPDFPA
jgi:hypothetical protein